MRQPTTLSKRQRRFAPWITLTALGLSLPAVASAQDGVDVPPGYEDAVAADEDAADAAVEEAAVGVIEMEEVEERGKINARVLQLERQFLPHFQRIFAVERSFIPRVCELTDQRRRDLAKAIDGIPKQAAREYAIWQNKLMQRQVRRRSSPTLDSRALILDELKLAVRKCLRPEQVKRYEAELTKRAEHRKRAAVLNLVVKLDQVLMLTAQQRAKLTSSLTENWQAVWASSPQVFRQQMGFLPQIPDQHVVSVLNPTQRTIWRGAVKHNIQSWGGMGFGNAFMIVDDFEVVVE